MNKVKESLMKAEVKATTALMSNDANLKKRQKWGKFGFTIISTMSMLAMMCCTALAAPDSIEGKIATGMESIYKIITGIVVPIAIVALAFAAFQFFMGGEKGMEKAKKCALYTIIGIGVVYLAPFLVSTVAGWFTGGNDDSSVWNGTFTVN